MGGFWVGGGGERVGGCGEDFGFVAGAGGGGGGVEEDVEEGVDVEVGELEGAG